MKFIFPQNYKFKNKIFGVMDYTTAIINIIIYVVVYYLLKIFIHSIKIKIFMFVLICFPCFLLSIINTNKENIFCVIKYIIKYIKNSKLYLYK